MTEPTSLARTWNGLTLGEIATSALRFWERGRPLYNAALAAIVAGYFVAYLPGSLARLDLDSLLTLFVLAVGANVVYSLAYVVDLFVQLSGFRAAWLGRRWILFAVGTACASAITRFMVMAYFSVPARH